MDNSAKSCQSLASPVSGICSVTSALQSKSLSPGISAEKLSVANSESAVNSSSKLPKSKLSSAIGAGESNISKDASVELFVNHSIPASSAT